MAQSVTPEHLGAEVLMQNYLPILTAEIEELGSILSRAPRVANYQTIAINPGDVVQLVGFDAARATLTLWGSSATLYVGNRENLEIAGNTGGSAPGVLLTQAPGTLQLQNTGHLFGVNKGVAVAYIYVVTESYSAQ